MRACSVCPFATRVRAGITCSMYTLVPLWDCSTSEKHLATAACLRSTPPQYWRPLKWCSCASTGLPQIWPVALLWGRSVPRLRGQQLRSVATSVSWLQLHGNSGPQTRVLHCWVACAAVCEVDCESSTARSTGEVVRLSRSCLWGCCWMEETSFFWMAFWRRAAPSGLRRKAGLFICSESVV